jgi:hypothetical protein
MTPVSGLKARPPRCVWRVPYRQSKQGYDNRSSAVLPSTSASCYHNCCIDGGTGLEYFVYTLIHHVPVVTFLTNMFLTFVICRMMKEGLLSLVDQPFGGGRAAFCNPYLLFSDNSANDCDTIAGPVIG